MVSLARYRLQLAVTEHPHMPMIVGVPRSGTTLLRLMLDAHPALAIPPETGFLAWSSRLAALKWMNGAVTREALFRAITRLPLQAGPWRDFGLDADEFKEALQQIEPFDVGEGFRAFYRLYARKQGKPRYGDKTPLYCRHLPAIEKVLPEAHFIHVIRDGRDVALSLRPMWFAPGRDMGTLARYWSKMVQDTQQAGRHANSYLEVRYEELIANPVATLKRVCCFLKLDFDPAMLRYWEHAAVRLEEHKIRFGIHGNVVATHDERLGQHRLTLQPPQAERTFCWKREMTPEERSEFAHAGATMLAALGYDS